MGTDDPPRVERVGISRNAILAKIVLRILCSMLERKTGKCLMTMSGYPRNIIGGGSNFPVRRVNEVP